MFDCELRKRKEDFGGGGREEECRFKGSIWVSEGMRSGGDEQITKVIVNNQRDKRMRIERVISVTDPEGQAYAVQLFSPNEINQR